ncbi:MAG: ABC transporter ATP-binding protein [Eubacteriales bacterium]
MSEPLLKIKDLNIAYDHKDNIVVKDFNLALEQGKILAIVGESGCGKTTLIRGIMGILPPSALITGGEVVFNGISLRNNKKFKKGKDISFVFQNTGSMLNPVRTIGQQFVEYIRIHEKMSKAEAKALAVKTLAKVQLEEGEHILNNYPFQLSGGMQQRVGIAMAITFHPSLILADEPTSALDVTTQIQVLDLLKEINQEFGTSIIFVTHNLGAASYLADDCLVMFQGSVVEKNTIKEVISAPQHNYTKNLIEASRLEGERK